MVVVYYIAIISA